MYHTQTGEDYTQVNPRLFLLWCYLIVHFPLMFHNVSFINGFVCKVTISFSNRQMFWENNMRMAERKSPLASRGVKRG